MSEGPVMFDTVLYGVISVTVVSLLSLGGACIGPLMTKDAKHRWAWVGVETVFIAKF